MMVEYFMPQDLEQKLSQITRKVSDSRRKLTLGFIVTAAQKQNEEKENAI